MSARRYPTHRLRISRTAEAASRHRIAAWWRRGRWAQGRCGASERAHALDARPAPSPTGRRRVARGTARVVARARCTVRPRRASSRRRPALAGGLDAHPAQLGELQLGVEVVARAVQHRGHEPGEVRAPPDAGQRAVGVAVDQVGLLLLEQPHQRGGQQGHVGDGEVEALGAGRRHDVRGVAGEEQPAAAHRGADERAHRQHRLLGDRAGVELPAVEGEARREVVPDPVVGPVLDLLVGVDLQVEPRDLRRAHRVQREALGVPGVDQLVGRGRGVGQDAEPGVGVGALPHPRRRCPAGRPAGRRRGSRRCRRSTSHSSTCGVAVGVGEADPRAVGVDVLGRDVGDLEQQRRAAVQLRLDQVLGDLGLAVDPDRAAAQRREVQLVPGARVLQVDAAVLEALAVQPVADAGVDERVDGVLLEDAGADAGLDVVPRPVLQDDVVDALQRAGAATAAGRPGRRR